MLQKTFSWVLGIILLFVYWNVYESIDSTLFGPTKALPIDSPEKAKFTIDVYPGSKLSEKSGPDPYYDGEDETARLWSYTWIMTAPNPKATVVDYYKRRIGAPRLDNASEDYYDAVSFVKEVEGGKKGERTEITVVDQEGTCYYKIDQFVASNESTLGWKTRRNIVHVIILGGIAAIVGLASWGLNRMSAQQQEAESSSSGGFGGVATPSRPPSVVTPPSPPSIVAQPDEPTPPPAVPAPPSDDETFFAELKEKIAADHPDWKIGLTKFELTVHRQGKQPIAVDTEPLFYLWKRPNVDRDQAIAQFLSGRIK